MSGWSGSRTGLAQPPPTPSPMKLKPRIAWVGEPMRLIQSPPKFRTQVPEHQGKGLFNLVLQFADVRIPAGRLASLQPGSKRGLWVKHKKQMCSTWHPHLPAKGSVLEFTCPQPFSMWPSLTYPGGHRASWCEGVPLLFVKTVNFTPFQAEGPEPGSVASTGNGKVACPRRQRRQGGVFRPHWSDISHRLQGSRCQQGPQGCSPPANRRTAQGS